MLDTLTTNQLRRRTQPSMGGHWWKNHEWLYLPSCTVTPQLSHWIISSASSLLSPRQTQHMRMCWVLQVWDRSCRASWENKKESDSKSASWLLNFSDQVSRSLGSQWSFHNHWYHVQIDIQQHHLGLHSRLNARQISGCVVLGTITSSSPTVNASVTPGYMLSPFLCFLFMHATHISTNNGCWQHSHGQPEHR